MISRYFFEDFPLGNYEKLEPWLLMKWYWWFMKHMAPRPGIQHGDTRIRRAGLGLRRSPEALAVTVD